MEMSNDWETYGLEEQWLPGNAIFLCSDHKNMHVRQVSIIDDWQLRIKASQFQFNSSANKVTETNMKIIYRDEWHTILR